MSDQHRSPEYRKNAAIVRQRVTRARRMGQAVECGRCGHEIDDRGSYDVGHRDPSAGHALDNLTPEHRYKIPGLCQGNRSAGGRVGATRAAAARGTNLGLPTW